MTICFLITSVLLFPQPIIDGFKDIEVEPEHGVLLSQQLIYDAEVHGKYYQSIQTIQSYLYEASSENSEFEKNLVNALVVLLHSWQEDHLMDSIALFSGPQDSYLIFGGDYYSGPEFSNSAWLKLEISFVGKMVLLNDLFEEPAVLSLTEKMKLQPNSSFFVLKKMSLSNLLRFISAQSKLTLFMGESEKRISGIVDGASWLDFIQGICHKASVQFQINDQTIVVKPYDRQVFVGTKIEKISVVDIDLRDFIDFLSKQEGLKYEDDKNLLEGLSINIEAEDEPWDSILTRALNFHDLGFNYDAQEKELVIFPLKMVAPKND